MNIGKVIKQAQGYKAYIPSSFPPDRLPDLGTKTRSIHNRATFALGKLDGITEVLPDLDFFIFMYVRKEASFSTEIEGTKATMADSIKADSGIDADIPADVENIIKYIEAMNQGLQRLDDIPLSTRLIKEIHKTLLTDTEDGIGSTPGKFRKSQNWIGGNSPETARYVPPPAANIANAMSDLEKYLHNEREATPALIKTALAHAQFETIHPFLDGNGRTGRLLITFYLCQLGLLDKPVLYLSAYFREHREAYFDLINRYHNNSEIIPWITFFLQGVAEVSEDAIETAKTIHDIRTQDLKKVQALGRRSENAALVLKKLFELPIINVKKVEEWTGLSRPSANSLVTAFVENKILKQQDEDKTYDRRFEYEQYLSAFTENRKEK